MNKYINGKIYAIVSESAGLTYYGSTIQRLSQRKGEHAMAYRNALIHNCYKCSSFEVLKHKDAKIVIIGMPKRIDFVRNNKQVKTAAKDQK